MRLRSEVWIKAYLRTVAAAGAFATVVRHGDEDRGAVFIKVRRLDGTADLYGPAPAGLDEIEARQLWTLASKPAAAEADIDARLARERDFDSDLWVIEVEDRTGRHFLDDWLARAAR